MRLALGFIAVLSGCSSNVCKQLVSQEDVADALGTDATVRTSSTKVSCNISYLGAKSPHGYDVELDLAKVPRQYSAARFESAAEELKKSRGGVVLPGLGEEAVAHFIEPQVDAPKEDPKEVVDQMLQRAAIDRANARLNALTDGGTFDGTPEELKKAPRNVNEFLAKLPPRQHTVLFRQGEWVGSFSIDKDAMNEAQVKQLMQRIASRVAKLD